MWSTREGNGKPLQYSCFESPMNSMKRQNNRLLKEELPRSVSAQYVTGGQWRPGGETSHPRSGAARRSHLAPEARGGDLEEPTQTRGQGRQPGRATQGVLAAQALEGQEELSHVEGQERWW